MIIVISDNDDETNHRGGAPPHRAGEAGVQTLLPQGLNIHAVGICDLKVCDIQIICRDNKAILFVWSGKYIEHNLYFLFLENHLSDSGARKCDLL